MADRTQRVGGDGVTLEVTVRPERKGEAAEIRRVLSASFPSAGEATLVDALRDAGNLAVPLVALADDVVVGYIAFSPVRCMVGRAGLGLAPVAVVPEARSLGVGSALVRAGLAACSAVACGWVVVLGDPGFYARFGFAPAAGFGLCDQYGGSLSFQALELAEGALPSGAGLVCYGPEFASL